MWMRAVGYIWFSTEEQSQQGVSFSNQEQKIRAYCTAKDWEMIAVIRDEGCSGKDLNRPGIQEIIMGNKTAVRNGDVLTADLFWLPARTRIYYLSIINH
jgi:site-specific DNA recombinase